MIAKFLDLNHYSVMEKGDFTLITTDCNDSYLSEEYLFDTSILDIYENIKSKTNRESLISVLDYGDEIRAIITIDEANHGYIIIKH